MYTAMSEPRGRVLARWRLVLGRFADGGLANFLAGYQYYGRMDRVLQFLYGREYESRGVRRETERQGDMSQSLLTVPMWLREARELFPADTMEVLEKHALSRYNLTELVTDPEVLGRLEPNYELLKAVLTFRGMMEGEVLNTARRVVRQVLEELRRKLAREAQTVLWGRAGRRPTRRQAGGKLHWQRTIRANLKHYDAGQGRLLAEVLHFVSRNRRHMPWHIILAVDCSGSMIDSVIHSAVMAAIFAGLPAVQVNLVAFDTSIVDLSDQVDDPTEVLMSVQLGGGTDIGGAMQYCETLVRDPLRTVMILVTDFFEGGPPGRLVRCVKRMRESGVQVLGLAALDSQAQPAYDRELAQRCATAGAEVSALTPSRLIEWLDGILR